MYNKITFREFRWLVMYRNQDDVPMFVAHIRFRHAWYVLMQAIENEITNTITTVKTALARSRA